MFMLVTITLHMKVTQCRNVAALPESYTLMPQVDMRVTSISAPALPGAVQGNGEELEQALEQVLKEGRRYYIIVAKIN